MREVASVKELEKIWCMCADGKRICKEFQVSVVKWSGEKRAPEKRNVKREKAATKEHYKWMLPHFNVQEDKFRCKRTKKPKVVSIWTTCKLCMFKYRLKIKYCEDQIKELFAALWMYQTYGEYTLFGELKRS